MYLYQNYFKKIIKIIIFIYFKKNTLKNNHYHIFKHLLWKVWDEILVMREKWVVVIKILKFEILNSIQYDFVFR